MSNPLSVTILGMVWYKPEHYDAVLRVMADSHKLPRTFHEWRMQAESHEKQFRRGGKIVVRAFIDPETFPDWCLARGLNIDAQARNRFAALVAKETMERSHGEVGGMH